jgi:hypothetical protein
VAESYEDGEAYYGVDSDGDKGHKQGRDRGGIGASGGLEGRCRRRIVSGGANSGITTAGVLFTSVD